MEESFSSFRHSPSHLSVLGFLSEREETRNDEDLYEDDKDLYEVLYEDLYEDDKDLYEDDKDLYKDLYEDDEDQNESKREKRSNSRLIEHWLLLLWSE